MEEIIESGRLIGSKKIKKTMISIEKEWKTNTTMKTIDELIKNKNRHIKIMENTIEKNKPKEIEKKEIVIKHIGHQRKKPEKNKDYFFGKKATVVKEPTNAQFEFIGVIKQKKEKNNELDTIIKKYEKYIGFLKKNEELIKEIEKVVLGLEQLNGDANTLLGMDNFDLEKEGIPGLNKAYDQKENIKSDTEGSTFALNIKRDFDLLTNYNVAEDNINLYLFIEKDDNEIKKCLLYNTRIFLNMLLLIQYEDGAGLHKIDKDILLGLFNKKKNTLTLLCVESAILMLDKENGISGENILNKRENLYKLVTNSFMDFVSKNIVVLLDDDKKKYMNSIIDNYRLAQ